MATNDSRPDEPGFVPFFRSYTRTWVHAVATAGLTAFGTLTIVHRWFAALALASYVVPPVVLYFRKLRQHERAVSTPAEGEPETDTDAPPDTDVVSEPEPEVASESGTESGVEPKTEPEPEHEPEPDSEPEPAATPARDDQPSAGGATLEDAGLHRPDASDRDDEPGDTDAEHADRIDGDGRSDEETGEADEAAETDAERARWERVDVPAATALFDVTVTESGSVYAAGAGGLVVAETGQGWTTVLEDGPAARGNDLRGADATADGDAIWVAGDGGAVGRIDADTGRHVDYTAPADRTDNLAGVAVGGPAGDETVLLINGSGEVLRGCYADGAPSWDEPVKPGSGSSMADVAIADAAGGADGGDGADGAVGYCCDTNDGVFETDDGGESFARIGLEGADGTLEAVATAGRDDCLVSADDGVVHRYGGAETWTPERVADAALTGIARRGDRTAVCATDGTIYERSGPAAEWVPFETDASGPLHAVSIGSERAVAVGDDGAVLERRK